MHYTICGGVLNSGLPKLLAHQWNFLVFLAITIFYVFFEIVDLLCISFCDESIFRLTYKSFFTNIRFFIYNGSSLSIFRLTSPLIKVFFLAQFASVAISSLHKHPRLQTLTNICCNFSTMFVRIFTVVCKRAKTSKGATKPSQYLIFKTTRDKIQHSIFFNNPDKFKHCQRHNGPSL